MNLRFALSQKFNFVSIVADNTETYYVINNDKHERIHRRTAIGLLQRNKNNELNIYTPVFMNEKGEFQIIGDENDIAMGPYDTFTVGIPKVLGEIEHIKNATIPEDVEPLIIRLKKEFNITFKNPAMQNIALRVRTSPKCKEFWLDNISCPEELPFDYASGMWESKYIFDSENHLKIIGKWLGLFRYACDNPNLSYYLFFDRTTGVSKEWFEGSDEPSMEEQKETDSKNQKKYAKKWEEIIHEEADRHYKFLKETYE